MNFKNVNFKNILPNTGDQRTSFEDFCCQIARHGDYSVPDGSKPVRIQGEGGDGGVEFYWVLPDGFEWGWQAKYVFEFGKLKSQAKKSFVTAITIHPKLKKYFICIPFDLTDNTTKGKGQRHYFLEFKKQLEELADKRGKQVEIILEQKFELLDKLIAFDKLGGRLKYWFDSKILGKEWINKHVVNTISRIPRYTPELKVGTNISAQLSAFIHSDSWDTELKTIYIELRDKASFWASVVSTKDDRNWGTKFPEDLLERGNESVAKVLRVQKESEKIVIEKSVPDNSQSILFAINDCLKHLRELTVEIKQGLVKKYGEDKVESENFRQFEAEYNVGFPMVNYDTAIDLANILEKLQGWIQKNFIEIYNTRCLLITGEWGVGKTFAICDLAEIRRRKEHPCILLFGDCFSNGSEVWIGIQNQLGFQLESKDELFCMLQASAEMHGGDLIICIDAVNETTPRSYWHSRINSLLADITPYPNLRLCISCRTSYRDQLLEEISGCVELVHPGFKGVEHEAATSFFNFYGLVPPIIPIIHPEFANPLFLRLVCQTLKSANLKQMPNGWQGISTIIKAFLEEINKALMKDYEIDKRYHIPEKALQKYVVETKKLKKNILSWDEANKVVNEAIKEAGIENSIKQPLLQWLIDEHLLFVDTVKSENDKEKEYVRISFERLGDHLLAASLIDGYEKADLQKKFAVGGDLHYLVSNIQAIHDNKSILETLSIQLPEKCGTELPEIVGSEVYDEILQVSLGQLHWRDPSYFNQRTIDLVNSGLRGQQSYLVFDELVMCAFIPSKIDSYLLDSLLRRNSMIQRDPFWCAYLHSRYETEKTIKNILDYSLLQIVSNIPQDILERWCILLCWFLAAADRRVRDKATKALVNLTEKQPEIWMRLLKIFISTDDEYILERVILSAYGTLLRTRNIILKKEIAIFVNDNIFSQPGAMLNAVIRDHARSIVELALKDEAVKKNELINSFIPPYQSNSKDMLRVPSEVEIEEVKKQTDKTKLEVSCFHDDFFNYTLGAFRKYEHFMSKTDMAKWIFVHIANMGYNTRSFSGYEGYMIHTFGGGRAKPVWAERIGKKYQWIALFRLAGLFSDNVEAKIREWDPEPLNPPLMFERGRQIDPSILCKEPKTQEFYENDLYKWYKYSSYKQLSDEKWIRIKRDMPAFAEIQQKLGGNNYLLLNGYLEQADIGDFDTKNKEHRRFWILIRSYLVNKKDEAKAWGWLSKKNFMGGWMPEGASYHEGFVGEYPWGISFNVYEDSYLSYGGYPKSKEFPYLFIPTSATLSSKNEYDSSDRGDFTVYIPAKIFFEKNKLAWNNLDGYILDNKLVLFDPSINEKRKGALLAERDYLGHFLRGNKYVLIWTVLAEKLISGIHNNRFIRQTSNQIHKLDEDGNIKSSKPVIEIK